MATADWKPVDQEPDDYGYYLVKVVGEAKSTMALYNHPFGELETGWYQEFQGGYVKLKATHWDHLPE